MPATTPALSPAAQCELDQLERATIDGGNWFSDYMAMLHRLANQEIPDMADVEIKGRGMDALRGSRDKFRVAVELKAYALAKLPRDISAALAKLPELATLDDFLDRLMPNTGKQVRRERFAAFLAFDAETGVDEQMKLHPHNLTRNGAIAEMVRVRLANLEHADIPRASQYDIQESFRAWWKTQEGGNPLNKTNGGKTMTAAARRQSMVKLLPKYQAGKGYSTFEWLQATTDAGVLKSERTFRRDIKQMVDESLVHKQKNGSFRQIQKKK